MKDEKPVLVQYEMPEKKPIELHQTLTHQIEILLSINGIDLEDRQFLAQRILDVLTFHVDGIRDAIQESLNYVDRHYDEKNLADFLAHKIIAQLKSGII